VKSFQKISFLFLILFPAGFQAGLSQVQDQPTSKTRNHIITGSPESEQYEMHTDDTLRLFRSGNKWVNELQNSVILPPKGKITDTLPTLRGEQEFLPYKGLIIRSIRFVKLDVFGTNIYDTIPAKVNWLQEKGNAIHVKTNTRILQQHLLFREGDEIDPRVLADNLRIFREQSYIEDARILVEPVLLMQGFADIVVFIKDQWSKAFYLEMNDINAGRLEVWDRNIFGTGNEIQNNFYWDPAKSDTWGYEAIYNNRNILGSFIDGKFYFSNVFDSEAYGVQFNRKFFTPNTKYAGGASAYHRSAMEKIWDPDTGIFSNRVSSNTTDLWIGRALKLNERAEIGVNRINLILASRIYRQNFFDRPVVSINKYYEFQDKTVWLNTFALSSQSFYQSNLIYSYGRTEDIPIGTLVNLTAGPEFGEFGNRFYGSLSLSRGNYISNLGYFYLKAEEGGFFTKSGNFEQAMFHLQLKYFSNLFIYGSFKFRQFISFDLTRGFKRFDDERITINDKYGLRGFNEPNVSGQQRMVMNMETVTFSPWYLYGFRFTFFGYMDFALLGPEDVNLMYEDVYTGIGIGTRIKNERLVFPTFSFRFGFYPNLQNIPLGDKVHFSGEPRLKPNNFYVTNPEMIDFQ
jgi:hypothetical protein